MSEARDIHERLKAQAAAELAQAEREAHAAGKEPFDLSRFEQLFMRGPQAAREEGRRGQYYISHPEIHTLEEFVAFLHSIEPWEDSL